MLQLLPLEVLALLRHPRAAPVQARPWLGQARGGDRGAEVWRSLEQQRRRRHASPHADRVRAATAAVAGGAREPATTCATHMADS